VKKPSKIKILEENKEQSNAKTETWLVNQTLLRLQM